MPRTVTVTSLKNPIVHRVQDAAQGELPGEMVVDGNHLVEDALAAELRIRAACWSERLEKARNGFDLRRRLEQRADECYACTDQVLQRMSSLTTHQGVLAVVEIPRCEDAALLGAAGGALVVAAAGVKDPGNLGAMIRTTEAAGGTGFVALQGGADPFRDKAVRGSAGSVMRLPIRHGLDAAALVAFARAHGLQIVGTDAQADVDYLDVDWRLPTIVVLGNEGLGLPADVRAVADRVVRVPIAPPVDSLNVAVTTGVLLFEARRQRR
ncbi:MAG: RNA methyltransferase [Planctomycetes bacterium]|nr:RNA methyltransferase [Planctomycetota bacterium]